MPGMEGLEVLRVIKGIEPGVRVVMATAFGTVDLAREAMSLGASGLLRKPFTADVLRAAIVTTLGSHIPVSPTKTPQFQNVSVNGFRLESMGDTQSIGRHEFRIHGPKLGPSRCIVEMSESFIGTVEKRSNRDTLRGDTDFWRWMAEEALANYIWQNAAPPEEGLLVVNDLTSNLTRWINAVLAK